MGEAFITRRGGGGGSAGLNFRVIGGTVEPSNPKENDIWVNTGTDITSWDFNAAQPYYRSNNKNFITHPFEFTTRTITGITYTDNGDGTVTANGTATSDSAFRLSFVTAEAMAMYLPAGQYFLSGCPAGGSAATYRLEVKSFTDETTLAIDIGSGAAFTLNKPHIARANIVIANGTTVSELTFKPQLEKGSAATTFVKGDATGQVWVSIGTSSQVEFNALKKNGLQVYPLSAKQYVSGAWVDKTAKSYQGSEWVDWWDGGLYVDGNTYDSITGGWATSANGVNSNYPNTGVAPTVTYNASSVHIEQVDGKSGLWYTKNKISLSGKAKLSVSYSFTTNKSNTEAYLQIRTGVTGYTSAHSEIVAKASIVKGGSTASIDLSSLNLGSNEKYYVCIAAYSIMESDITKIRLE